MSDLISRQTAIDGFYEMASDMDHLCTVSDYVSFLESLPPAQPEIIYCGDCRYKDDGIDEDGIPFLKCLHDRSYGSTKINDFCSWAERRNDG